jgi:hypothetical protein
MLGKSQLSQHSRLSAEPECMMKPMAGASRAANLRSLRFIERLDARFAPHRSPYEHRHQLASRPRDGRLSHLGVDMVGDCTCVKGKSHDHRRPSSGEQPIAARALAP